MRKTYLRRTCLYLPMLFLALTFASCSSTKNIKYFQDLPDSGKMKTIKGSVYVEPTIQVDDILTILVQTVDPQATANISQGNIPVLGNATPLTGTPSALSNTPVAGYLVGKNGEIQVPVLGSIKLLGYTTQEARDIILKEAVKYFKDPTVIVRFANFKISVTGEVLKPGQYLMPGEKVSILDALAMAGDLTVYGKRDNVLLLRENIDGTKTPYRINLNKSNIISSPFYYLKQNDIIYVEPGKGKAAANDASQTKMYALISGILSIVIIVVSRVNFK